MHTESRPTERAETEGSYTRPEILTTYDAWLLYAAKIERETGLRPLLFMTLDGRAFGN